jgi:fido (protein-threonine AMPylation protein)
MALELQYPPGATPLDPDEAKELIPAGVTTVAELNAYEAENILAALSWLDRRRKLAVLDDEFVRELHRRMFDQTWRWSGAFRLTEKNIGVAPEKISVSVQAHGGSAASAGGRTGLFLGCRGSCECRSGSRTVHRFAA